MENVTSSILCHKTVIVLSELLKQFSYNFADYCMLQDYPYFSATWLQFTK